MTGITPVHGGFSRLSGWMLAAVAFGIAVLGLMIFYWPTFFSLAWVWDHDGTYQYAFLIPPLSLWMAFDLRRKVRANAAMPSIWGLLATVALVAVWYVGHLLDVNLIKHFAVLALFPALVLACWGWRALRVLVFPLAYLVVFAVPWGDGLVGPLQDITAHLAVHVLEWTGTPALLNGREITTPAAVWMVADACSGVKFFIACAALGCLYAYLMYRRWRKRVVFVALAAVVPVIANGFRVYFTILIGDTWGLEYATGMDHLIFGWQFFGSVLVLLLWGGWFFRDPVLTDTPPETNNSRPSRARIAVWPLALLVLIAGPLVARKMPAPDVTQELHLSAPDASGWNVLQGVTDNWRPSFSGASGQTRAAYRAQADGEMVELFHALYVGKPRRGHTLITYGNDLYDPSQAHILSSTRQNLKLSDGRTVTAGELRLSEPAGSRLVWFWYCVDSRCTPSATSVKLLQAWDMVRGAVPRSSVWALSVPVGEGGVDQARGRLRGFARVLSTRVDKASHTPREHPASGSEP